jgi:hypothetical protein
MTKRGAYYCLTEQNAPVTGLQAGHSDPKRETKTSLIERAVLKHLLAHQKLASGELIEFMRADGTLSDSENVNLVYNILKRMETKGKLIKNGRTFILDPNGEWDLSGPIDPPRAFSVHSGSYPAALKKLAHSVGVMSAAMRAMASQRPSTDRSAAFRSSALSLEKAFSIGLKSGL